MSFWQLFLADLKSMIRNRMALFWFLAFPVIFILIFGAVFSGGQQPAVQIGLVYQPAILWPRASSRACRESRPSRSTPARSTLSSTP